MWWEGMGIREGGFGAQVGDVVGIAIGLWWGFVWMMM